MAALTVHEAASTTGWSARMLRYLDSQGLVEPERSTGGYRLYGPGQLQRLRTLRELLDEHALALSDIGFAQRLDREPALRAAVEEWLAAEPERPDDVPAEQWLRWEQDKHEKLLASVPRDLPATSRGVA